MIYEVLKWLWDRVFCFFGIEITNHTWKWYEVTNNDELEEIDNLTVFDMLQKRAM